MYVYHIEIQYEIVGRLKRNVIISHSVDETLENVQKETHTRIRNNNAINETSVAAERFFSGRLNGLGPFL